MGHFHKYLYGRNITVFTDHAAVKAVLQTPNPSSKHARWWTKVYGNGVKEVQIIYRAGRENLNADALSCLPHSPAPTEGVAEGEIQVCAITNETKIQSFLRMDPETITPRIYIDFSQEQKKDPQLCETTCFLTSRKVPAVEKLAEKVIIQQNLFTLIDNILYYVDRMLRRITKGGLWSHNMLGREFLWRHTVMQ